MSVRRVIIALAYLIGGGDMNPPCTDKVGKHWRKPLAAIFAIILVFVMACIAIAGFSSSR